MNSDDMSESDSKLATPDFTPRRATRHRTKPKKYDEYFESSPTKRRSYKNVESSDEEINEEPLSKPKALFSNDDVEGQDIFRFKSRHTKHDLQNKVKAVVGNVAPSPTKTPKKNTHLLQKINHGNTQTPKHVVDKIKKKIIAKVENSSDSDYSGSSSDFVPDKSDESSASSGSDSDTGNEIEMKTSTGAQVARNKNRMKTKESEYFVKSDNYFMMNSTKKITTSDHTLARLKNMNIQEEQSSCDYVTPEHRIKISELIETYGQLFDKWLFELNEGFNILLYGIGSKRNIVQRFQETLKSTPCIVINGFFPSLTMKNILECIVIDLLDDSHVSSNMGDVLCVIETRLRDLDTYLLVVVHNIDGVMLRSGKCQAALAGLAALEHVKLVATIDHINAPLLWDHSKLSKYKFLYYDVTSFLPYEHEAPGVAHTHQAGGLQLAALNSVYRSLTNNAKGIFNIIVEYQLQNHKQSHYQGVPLKELYSLARERFLCSSDAVLRAHLTEFIDHRLMRIKRADDGDYVKVLLDTEVLRGFTHTLLDTGT
ncbi:origin recognition complex subunit 2 [Danaus plexippus]|uniref:origin recognition complex subunit 2 n=1 Tax=Danaus plexippus TaxID=13037 RepID=UPI002AB2D6FA|nr:origin recognition complex subunit 2 [Danaus plexippus]